MTRAIAAEGHTAMFALSRDHKRAFIYHPPEGMAVPILLDLITLTHSVRMPAVTELADDFVVFDKIHDLATASGRPGDVHAAGNISHNYTRTFATELTRDDMTIARLRGLIEKRRAGAVTGKAVVTVSEG
jgi:hypothetical protein